MLTAKGIGVRRARRTVLDGVSFEAKKGELLAIVGPNGAGKTSLLEAVCGLVRCSTGTVAIDGVALGTFGDRSRTFSFMPDEVAPAEELALRDLWPGSVAPLLGVERWMDTSLAHLSRGERKRCELAIALARAKPFTVLDEPFAAFDPIQLDGILEAVKGKTILASIHQLDVAERVADRILLLAEGRAIGFGSMAELREKTQASSLEGVMRKLLHAA